MPQGPMMGDPGDMRVLDPQQLETMRMYYNALMGRTPNALVDQAFKQLPPQTPMMPPGLPPQMPGYAAPFDPREVINPSLFGR